MPRANLKTLRKAARFTQVELAKLAGVGVMTVIRAEKRNGWPTNRSVRQALERALGLT